MTTMMILSPSGLLLGLGSLAVYAWTRRKRPKSGTKPATPPKGLPPAPPSPFVSGSACTQLAGPVEVMQWVQQVVQPVMQPRLDAYDVPTDGGHHDEARQAIIELVDDVYALTVPECDSQATGAARTVWKALWCEAALALVKAGKLDEEVNNVVRLCFDEGFDPRAPKAPTLPPPPVPMPMDGSPAPEPPGGEGTLPPTNAWRASSRQELSQLGVMRLLEGTAAGSPIVGPAARVVLLAFNPVYPGLAQARADMQRLASEHPGVSFVEVSFADTQRHFGKPRDVHGLVWALAAGAPDGRVLPSPLVRHDPRDAPPTAEQWRQAIAHASGSLGFGRVRTAVRPRRFGDLIRAIAGERRATAMPQLRSRAKGGARGTRATRRHEPRRRGG